MNAFSKNFKIKIKNHSFSVVLDGSYLAENIYKIEGFDPKINGAHYHAQYELFIIGDDELTLFANNQKIVFKNCVLVIPPFVKHYAIRKSDHRIMLSHKFSADLPNIPFTLKSSPKIYNYSLKIKENFISHEAFADEITECFLKLLFCEIAKLNNKVTLKEYSPNNVGYFEKIENLLLNFNNDITLDDLSKELNLSKKQVARIIRKNYNTTFAEMVREKRLNAAAALLSSTDMPISSIVEYINFPTESYFYKKFKEAYNTTPLNYRKENRHRK